MSENTNDTEKEKGVNCRMSELKSLYKLSIETRNFEINQLMHRNNFFMIFQGVLLASVLQIEMYRPLLLFIVSLTGVCVSYYQMQVACGSKYWQIWWENRVRFFENKLKENKEIELEENRESEDFELLFAKDIQEIQQEVESDLRMEGGKLGRNGLLNCLIAKRYSVSRAPVMVSIALMVSWALLSLTTLFGALCVSVG
ncbi:MAG: hypothetical protein JRG71_11235 [Deltaproteobacteria bacterium]|nr:hypothetical protein [Deltaproteobacteria bacterium]